jgi:hypothetical protein
MDFRYQPSLSLLAAKVFLAKNQKILDVSYTLNSLFAAQIYRLKFCGSNFTAPLKSYQCNLFLVQDQACLGRNSNFQNFLQGSSYQKMCQKYYGLVMASPILIILSLITNLGCFTVEFFFFYIF